MTDYENIKFLIKAIEENNIKNIDIISEKIRIIGFSSYFGNLKLVSCYFSFRHPREEDITTFKIYIKDTKISIYMSDFFEYIKDSSKSITIRRCHNKEDNLEKICEKNINNCLSHFFRNLEKRIF